MSPVTQHEAEVGDGPDSDADHGRHVEGLYDRMRRTMRWRAIKDWKQQPGETVDDFLTRLTKAFRENSRMKPPENSHDEQRLKNCFMDGVDQQIRRQVCKHCVGWDRGRLSAVQDQTVHAEKNQRASETKAQRAETPLAGSPQSRGPAQRGGLCIEGPTGLYILHPEGPPDHWERDCLKW